jgi:hypothetical protein
VHTLADLKDQDPVRLTATVDVADDRPTLIGLILDELEQTLEVLSARHFPLDGAQAEVPDSTAKLLGARARVRCAARALRFLLGRG